MSKGFVSPLIIGIIVLVLVITGGAFYVGKIVNSPLDIVPVITTAPKPSPTLANETAGWKIYTSSCDFSIKYPQDWNAQKYFIQDSKDSCAFLTAPDYKQGSDTRSGFSITFIRMTKGDTSMGVALNTIDDYVKSIESTIQPLTPAKNKTTKMYGFISGTQFDFDAFESTTTFITLQGNYFYLVRWPTITQYNGPYRTSIDRILSTFKFQ